MGMYSFGREPCRRVSPSLIPFASVSTRCNTLFQDPTFPVGPFNLSEMTSRVRLYGLKALICFRWNPICSQARTNKSTRSPMAHMEFIHTLHSTTMEWTQEPGMPSFAQSGLMTPQTPQTPSNFDQRLFTTRSLEGYDYHQAAELQQ
jgi:hypothetical protein